MIQDKVSAEAFVQADSLMKENPDRNSLVLSCTDWHPGVIGIVASKMVEKYNRPCSVISINGEIGKGSLRTTNGINLFEVLKECDSSLIQFGGHAGAAGITIKLEEIDNFKDSFERSIEFYDYDFTETIDVDMEIAFDTVNSDLIDDIKKIEPFGKNNEVPVFLTSNLEVKSAETLKEGKHLRLLLSLDNQTRKGIWFNYSKDILEGQKADILLNKKVNVVYTIQKDTYKGNTNITLMIRDITTA